jgi:ribosomal protein S18 acetylase RimI-like enzyme
MPNAHPIRELLPQESDEGLEALLDAYLEIFNEPATLSAVSFSLRPYERETVRTWLTEADARCFTCADADGRIAGFQIALANPMEGFELWGCGVRSDTRGRGIGRALTQAAVDLASREGYRAVDGYVFADNAARLVSLLRLGFQPVEILHRSRADGGDLVRLRKTL